MSLNMIAFEGVAGIDGQDRFQSSDLRTMPEIPEVPCRRLTDSSMGCGALGGQPEGQSLLPVEAFVDEVAFEINATGEAKKVRLHRGHHFDEIGAVAIGPIL